MERDRHRESERQAKLANMCVATLVWAGVCVCECVSVPVRGESLTPAMPLLKTTSGWGIKRRHWSLGERGVQEKGQEERSRIAK